MGTCTAGDTLICNASYGHIKFDWLHLLGMFRLNSGSGSPAAEAMHAKAMHTVLQGIIADMITLLVDAYTTASSLQHHMTPHATSSTTVLQ